MQSLKSASVTNAVRSATRISQRAVSRKTRTLSTLNSSAVTGTLRPQTSRNVSRNPAIGLSATLLTSRTQHARHGSSSASSSEALQKTPLYDLHLAHGAQMVPFGGFHMPVQYKGLSVSASHAFTREHASIFDVSHMVQRIFSGSGAREFLERVTPSDLASLGVHRSTLSVLLKADGSGGIVDDTILTKLAEDKFYVVTNAGCREKDNEYFDQELAKAKASGLEVNQEQLDGWGLVALQGPEAEAVLADALDGNTDLKQLYFGQSVYGKVRLDGGKTSAPLLISRGGYTGEDGFEISIPPSETVEVTEKLLHVGGAEKVQLAGLGARDSLRLEAGMCLYGHDLDETVSPVEAALSWIIPPNRRKADAGYYGAETINSQLTPKSKGGNGVVRRRVGFIVTGAPAREGAEIVAKGDPTTKLGRITSGCPSPSLGKNIAMGYIKDGQHKSGTEVEVLVRGKARPAVVTKMPFVPSKYYKSA
ncbi:glycine cleavage system T protein [Neurospora tetrasperma FGSC 2509]|nr:glycine cleavage system T protein [Neurospora tetrasperma FGSC 2509]